MGIAAFLLAVALAWHGPVWAASSVQKEISISKKRLAETKKAYARMDKKLADIARQIARHRKRIARLEKVVAESEKRIAVNEVLLKEGREKLTETDRRAEALKKRQESLRRRLIDLLTNRYILEEIKRQKGIQSADDVVSGEAVGKLIAIDNDRIDRLQKEYKKISGEYERFAAESKRLRAMIERLERRKQKALREKRELEKLVADLQRERADYKARLERLQAEEASLRKTLAKLNIVRQKELEKARKAKERSRRKRASATAAKADRLKVRTIGSSFQKHAVGHYRGRKTISPVGRAKVVKKFGSYVDPIYGIRIFNESVTLQPYKKNAKVKSVLDGRVVFAKDTPMLGKVVIVEHRDGLHTIYAKMDKIAPTIREGKRIKKGYVIGRVKKELMFEVTRKNRHINPLELIRLR